MRVGDFMELVEHPGHFRLLVSAKKGSFDEFYTSYELFYHNDSYVNIISDIKSIYRQISPTKELVEEGKRLIELALNGCRIDNLTYVELYARMKEHEQELV